MRVVLSFIAPETCGASINVLEKNQGTEALIENPLSSARSKHTDVRFDFICELFKARKISVEYIASAEQHADILTKAVSIANFKYHRKHLMNLAEWGTIIYGAGLESSSSKCTSTSPEAGRPKTS